MGTIALATLIDGLAAGPTAPVRARRGGAWLSGESDFGEDVRNLAAALSGYGLHPGARAAVLGSEGRETLCAGLAVIAAGATVIPLDPALPDAALSRALGSSSAIHVMASDERQLARILALRPELSALELVLLLSAAPSERKPAALLADAAMSAGREALTANPDLLLHALASGDSSVSCITVDGRGDLRPVDRASLLSFAETISKALTLGPKSSMLLALPVGGVERLGASLAAISRRTALLLSDPAERPDAGLAEHAPESVVTNVSGIERLYRAWIEDMDSESWLSRRLTRWALRQGTETSRGGWRKGLAERIALRALRAKLGGRARTVDVFPGHRVKASSDIEDFFAAAGLTVRYLPAGPGPAVAR